MVTYWLIFIAGCWVGVTAGFGLALVLVGPKLRRLDESDDFFGPTLAYRQSASAARRQQTQTSGIPANARPSHIA